MSKYIDVDEVLEQIRKKLGIKSLDYLLEAERQIVDVIQSAPSIEPKRGEWINQHEDGHGSWVGTCNQCGKENHVDNYCPNCGAKMKGSDNE